MIELGFYLLSLLCVLLLLVLARNGGRFDYATPPFIFAILIIIGVVIRGAFFIVHGDSLYHEQMAIVGGLPLLNWGYLAITVAVMFFSLGYILPRKAFLTIEVLATKKSHSSLSILPVVWVLAALVLVHLYFLEMGVYSDLLTGKIGGKRYLYLDDGSRTSLTYFSWGGRILFVIFLIKLSKVGSLKAVPVIYWIFIAISFSVLIASSSRLAMILYVLAIWVVLRKVGDKSRTASKAKMAIYALIFFGLMALMGVLREINQSTEELGFSFVRVPEKFLDNLFYKPYLMAVDKTALIIVRTKERGLWLGGDSFLSVLVAPIPRTLWIEKPNVRVGQFVAVNIYDRDNKAGVPPGFVAELFINYSWFGIVMGMFLLGGVARLLYNRYNAAVVGDSFIALYSIVITHFFIVLLSADFVGASSQLFQCCIPYFLGCKNLKA